MQAKRRCRMRLTFCDTISQDRRLNGKKDPVGKEEYHIVKRRGSLGWIAFFLKGGNTK